MLPLHNKHVVRLMLKTSKPQGACTFTPVPVTLQIHLRLHLMCQHHLVPGTWYLVPVTLHIHFHPQQWCIHCWIE